MGEQSTLLWTMDPVWTGQVERNGTREVDTAELGAIKAQPDESTCPQQPGSSPITMSPNTRPRTALSSRAKTLPTLEEGLVNLDVGDEGKTAPQTPPPASSPDHDAEAVRQEDEDIEIRTTPKTRKVTPSAQSFQWDLAIRADPNGGRCLITNLPSRAVQWCHLVAQATKPQTVGVYGLHTSHYTHRLWHLDYEIGVCLGDRKLPPRHEV